MGHYIVWHHIWHVLVRTMAQRHASHLFAKGLGRIVRPHLYAQSANAVSLGSSHTCLSLICVVYFGVEALEEKEMNSVNLQILLSVCKY